MVQEQEQDYEQQHAQQRQQFLDSLSYCSGASI